MPCLSGQEIVWREAVRYLLSFNEPVPAVPRLTTIATDRAADPAARLTAACVLRWLGRSSADVTAAVRELVLHSDLSISSGARTELKLSRDDPNPVIISP